MSGNEALLILLVVGLFAGILSGVPVMLAIAGVPLLVALFGAAIGQFDLAFVQAYPQRVFGIMANPLLLAVPLFILMGILLDRSKIAERMLIVMSRALGGAKTGLAAAVVVVSALIAASTGIIGATIVMLGMMALPAMLNAGLSPRFSSGLICASGTLGQIIPPSIVLILLGDQVANAYLDGQRTAGNFAPDPVSVGTAPSSPACCWWGCTWPISSCWRARPFSPRDRRPDRPAPTCTPPPTSMPARR